MSPQQRLANLMVLATLAPGDKLDVSGNVFTRQRFFSGLRRTFSDQSASSYEGPIFQLFWDEIVIGLTDDVCNLNKKVHISECNAAFEGVKNLQQTYRISDKVSFFTGSTRKDKNANHESIDKFELLGKLVAEIAPLIIVLKQLPRIFLYRNGPVNKKVYIPTDLIDKKLDSIVSLPPSRDSSDTRRSFTNSSEKPMISPPRKAVNGYWVTAAFLEDQYRFQKINWNSSLLPNGDKTIGALEIICNTEGIGEEGLFALSQILSQAGLIGVATKFIGNFNTDEEYISLFAISNHLKANLFAFSNYQYFVNFLKGTQYLTVIATSKLDMTPPIVTFPLGATGSNHEQAMSYVFPEKHPLSELKLAFTFKVFIPAKRSKTPYKINTIEASLTYSCKKGEKSDDNPTNIFLRD